MSGKGSKRRPGEGYAEGYDRIFKKEKPKISRERFYVCAHCLEQNLRQIGPDKIDFCDTCDTIVEGHTLRSYRIIEHDHD